MPVPKSITVREMLDLVDKSEHKYAANTGHVHTDEFAEMFGFYGCYLGDAPRLTQYSVEYWYCTDSIVGLSVLYLDDKPVAICEQSGRKMGRDYRWVSKEAYNSVKEYIISLIPPEEDKIPLINLDEEYYPYYRIEYIGQLCGYHWDHCMYNGERVTIVEVPKRKPNHWDYERDTVTVLLGDGSKVEIKPGNLLFLSSLTKL